MSTPDPVQLEKLAKKLLDPHTSKKEENKAKKKLEKMDPGLIALRELNPELAGKVDKHLAPRQSGGIAVPQPVQAAAPGPAAGFGMGGASASGTVGAAAPALGGGASAQASSSANQASPAPMSGGAIGGTGQPTALEASRQVRTGTHKRARNNLQGQKQDLMAHNRAAEQNVLPVDPKVGPLGPPSNTVRPLRPGIGFSGGGPDNVAGGHPATSRIERERDIAFRRRKGTAVDSHSPSEEAAQSQTALNPLPDSPGVRPESPVETPSPSPGKK